MDFSEIKKLIEVVSTSDIAEVELELESVKIKLSKYSKESHIVVQGNTSQTVEPQAVQEALNVEMPRVQGDVASVENGNTIEIQSPMVGTFYRAPSPTSDPFISEGDRIKKGQSLCIIEAMKLMNEIESEYQGKLVNILVENGQPVEYGQPLFLLEAEE